MSTTITHGQQADVDFLTETMRWAYWPLCPVKRNGVVATCYDSPEGKRVVYVGNMLAIIEGVVKPSTLERIEYANSYQMVTDGWEVD